MSKIKLTKGELKRQRDSLKQYRRYLPTLQLKKQQLQMKILETRREIQAKVDELNRLELEIEKWMGLFADSALALTQIHSIEALLSSTEEGTFDPGTFPNTVLLKEWIVPAEVRTETVNIAGANVPYLLEIIFPPVEYDLYATPFWLDSGVEQLRRLIGLMTEVAIIEKRAAILEHELRVTSQRVNLFEKVKIPECIENIRRIRIYLGDVQANAVGISKVAKKKVEAIEETALAAV